MSSAFRLAREYVAQMLALGVTILDRLVVPAVLLRGVGVASFSAWSLATATAGFVAVLEFGVTRYYTNLILADLARGDRDQARHHYQVGATLIAVLLVGAIAVLWAGFAISGTGVGDPQLDRQLWAVIIPVTLAAASLQLLALRSVLYRGHGHYAFELMLRGVGDMLRIATIAALALSGLALVGIAWGWLGATLLFTVLPLWITTRRRYRGFDWQPQLPPAHRRGHLVRSAPGLWLQAMATVLYSSLPVLAIGALSASAVLIAQFVLMRTLANFVRQVLQSLANVLGLELAQRGAREDRGGQAAVFRETGRLLAVQTGVGAGALIVLAQPLFALWTGRAQLFDPVLLALAILPPLAAPTAYTSIEMLAYANRPWPLVRARLLQLGLTVVLVTALLSFVDVVRAFMAGLAIAEVLGLGLPLMLGVRNLNPLIGLRSNARIILHGAAAFVISVLIVGGVQRLLPGGLALGLATAALTFAAVVWALGLSTSRRQHVLEVARRRLGRAAS